MSYRVVSCCVVLLAQESMLLDDVAQVNHQSTERRECDVSAMLASGSRYFN